jgi:hypothetical protein
MTRKKSKQDVLVAIAGTEGKFSHGIPDADSLAA